MFHYENGTIRFWNSIKPVTYVRPPTENSEWKRRKVRSYKTIKGRNVVSNLWLRILIDEGQSRWPAVGQQSLACRWPTAMATNRSGLPVFSSVGSKYFLKKSHTVAAVTSPTIGGCPWLLARMGYGYLNIVHECIKIWLYFDDTCGSHIIKMG